MERAVAVGFLRLVQVRAASPDAAQTSAVQLVRADWAGSVYALGDRSGPPTLVVFRIGILSWWHRLFGAPKGYLFFSEDGVRIVPTE